jgi:L-alanine-DL-glutamate epimerase-like enolase superfamily enzyme
MSSGLGITESRKIAAVAQSYGLPVIPHVFSSAVSSIANMHFIASIPNGSWLEFDQNPNALRSDLSKSRCQWDLMAAYPFPIGRDSG